MNVIARLAFELANYDVTAQHVSYYTIGLLPESTVNIYLHNPSAMK